MAKETPSRTEIYVGQTVAKDALQALGQMLQDRAARTRIKQAIDQMDKEDEQALASGKASDIRNIQPSSAAEAAQPPGFYILPPKARRRRTIAEGG